MFVDENLIQRNQDVINFYNADLMIIEMNNFLEMFGDDYIFKRDFYLEEDLIQNYCIRSHVVKLAMDACEHYSKAILIQNGYSWDEMIGIGHNLLKAYNLFDNEDKNMIKASAFFNNLEDISQAMKQEEEQVERRKKRLDSYERGEIDILQLLRPSPPTPRIFISDKYKTDNLENLSFEEILLSFSSERVLPNIKSRYPGQTMVDYDEKFIVGYALILHELCNKYKEKNDFIDRYNEYFPLATSGYDCKMYR